MKFTALLVAILPLAAQEFEVASVKLTPPAARGFISVGPNGTNTYSVANMPLHGLVQVGFGVPYEQIVGIDKLGSEHYDVSAKAEDGVMLTPSELKPRVRHLLEERFHLKTHTELRDYDGYALVTAKGGAKLKPTSGATGGDSILPNGVRLSNFSLSEFASALRSTAGRPVVDKTEIVGRFDISLDWASDDNPQSPLPSFVTALQEQLGLRLEPSKVRLESVVIDSVDKIPTDN